MQVVAGRERLGHGDITADIGGGAQLHRRPVAADQDMAGRGDIEGSEPLAVPLDGVCCTLGLEHDARPVIAWATL